LVQRRSKKIEKGNKFIQHTRKTISIDDVCSLSFQNGLLWRLVERKRERQRKRERERERERERDIETERQKDREKNNTDIK